MRVIVEDGTVALDEPHRFDAFCVITTASTAELQRTLAAESAGHVESDHAFIRVEALRRLAGEDRPVGWDERLDGMVAYARTKGWTDAAGTAVRAHVERPDAADG